MLSPFKFLMIAIMVLSPYPAFAKEERYRVETLGSASCSSPVDENKVQKLIDIFSRDTVQERWFVQNDVIYLRGGIGSEDENYFKVLVAQVGDKLRKINVISGGGHVGPAISIGEYLHKHNLIVEVAGPCLSSCANYLFGFAKHRVILADGFLGFHGNLTALVNRGHGVERLPEKIAKLIEKSFGEEYPKELKALKKKYPNLGSSEIVTKIIEMFPKPPEDDETRMIMNKEKQIYGFFGIPQSFFDKTQTITRGYQGDDSTVDLSLLYPDKRTLSSLGFSPFFGRPNLCLAYHLFKKIREDAPTSILIATIKDRR